MTGPREQKIWEGPPLNDPRFCEPPVRTLAEYTKQPMAPESFVRVQGARVLLVDHAMLQHDFPELRSENLLARNPALKQLSAQARNCRLREVIECWLLKHIAYISQRQASQRYVNSSIPISPEETIQGWRAPGYGRAAILSIPESGGLIDVKGIGVDSAATPSRKHHSNGLLSLAGGLSEILFEHLLCAILRHTKMPYGVVPHYGLVDLGFKIRDRHGNESACLFARRAHTRPPLLWGNEDPGLEIARLLMKLELSLRQFGITSVTDASRWLMRNRGGALSLRIFRTWVKYPPSELELLRSLMNFKGSQMSFGGVNIQFTSAIERAPRQIVFVDFGAYSVQTRFSRAIFSSARASYSPLDGEIVLPSDSRFTQPEPDRSIPMEANTLPRRLARGYYMGHLNGQEILRRLNQFVSRFTAQIQAVLPKTSPDLGTPGLPASCLEN
ncbi:MAG TPA: hypothetical protein VHA33_22470 [Candidatus Angelobacter sp.]|nr:hypothetical protein [Candidatus Angelobacter sp.]